MTASKVVLLVFVLTLAVLAGSNWALLGEPRTVDYILSTMEVPLGLILLALLIVVLVFHVLTHWFRDASTAVTQWKSGHEMRQALERATVSDDHRIDKLAQDFEEHHEAIDKQLTKILDRLDDISIEAVIREEGDSVAERIEEAEKEILREVSKRD